MEIKEKIIELLKKETKQEQIVLEIPPNPEMGDFAFPCFSLAKTMKKSPIEIAKELNEKFKTIDFVKVEAKGPYLNFFANKEELIKTVLTEIDSKGEEYGKGTKKNEKLMIEFSEPNPFKGFHVGHLRNTALGEALCRICEFDGYDVIRINYYNDTGTHVSKAIWAWKKYHKGEKIEIDKGEWLGNIYTEANLKIEENPELKKEAEEIHRQIETGDKKVTSYLKKGKKWSEDHFNRIYKELDTHFDKIYYDGTLITQGKEVVNALMEKKVAEKSEGAIIVNLEKYNLPTALILKTDGSALYITKDFALVQMKVKDYDPDKMIYIVGSEQRLHFQQLFKILELYGFRQAKKCYHLSYELVMLPEGKMSSRKGGAILYSTLATEIKKKLKEEVEKRHSDWTEKAREKAVKEVFSSAIKFDMIKMDPNKTIIFDIDKSTEFEGESGPYIQYTHARICSILRKAKKVGNKIDFAVLNNPEEKEIAKKLKEFKEIVEKASGQYKPNYVANYLIELSQMFNDYYHKYNILKEENEKRYARLFLIKQIKQVISNGLYLLAIKAPERM